MSEQAKANLHSILPDTPSVKAALEFARKYLDNPTYNHVLRSALFSSILMSKASSDHLSQADKEVVVVADLLHDMAWNPLLESTRRFVSNDKRFEVDSANAARDFLNGLPKEYGWDQRRIQLVWDGIALHSSPSIAFHKEAEVALTGYGIFIDVTGNPAFPLPGVPAGVGLEQFSSIYADLPSLHLAKYVKGALCALCTQKPETTYDNFVSGYGEKYVEGYSLEGKKTVDLMEVRERAEEGA